MTKTIVFMSRLCNGGKKNVSKETSLVMEKVNLPLLEHYAMKAHGSLEIAQQLFFF